MRALARSDAAAAKVEALGAEAVRGDLGDRASLAAGAAGCATAFHLAAHLGEWGPWEDFERGNVEGTRNALAACAEAGVRRFVHCGTEAALMAGEPLVHVDETAPLRPDSRAPYPATKARAELAVREANRDGFETVVVRPRFVWGKGDTTLLPEMVKTVEAGRFAWVGGGGNVTDTAHVDNVVEGLVLGAEKGRPARPTSSPTASRSSSASSSPRCSGPRGSSRPTAACPAWTAAPLARVCELAWKLPLPGEPPMTRFRSWVLTQECTIDIRKAREELGYEPLVSHEQGLAELRAA